MSVRLTIAERLRKFQKKPEKLALKINRAEAKVRSRTTG